MFLDHSWSIFEIFGQKKFSQKIWLCHAQLHMGLQHHAKIQKQKDERTNRCYFIGPFRLLLGIQKRFPLGISSVNVSKYTVEMVRIISNDKHKEFTHSRNLHLPPLHLPNNVIGHLTVLTKLMPSSNRILTKNMVN